MLVLLLVLILCFFGWCIFYQPKKPSKVDETIKESKSGIYIYDYVSSITNVNIHSYDGTLKPGYYLCDVYACKYSYAANMGNVVICYFEDCDNSVIYNMKINSTYEIKCLVHLCDKPTAIVFFQKKQINTYSLIEKLKVML